MEIVDILRAELREEEGFELYPFQIGWYNAVVGTPFKFSYPDDTLAVLVISAPNFFENIFLPWLTQNYGTCSAEELENKMKDPLDECVEQRLQTALKNIETERGPESVEIIHDFDLTPSRRPKILMPTCGHVAGATYYYQKSQLTHDPWPTLKGLLGLALHPRYGGWFAFRASFVFPHISVPSLTQPLPLKQLETEEQVKDALEKFLFHWQDWTYRDVNNPVERYSTKQKDYFGTLPVDRWKLLRKWLCNN